MSDDYPVTGKEWRMLVKARYMAVHVHDAATLASAALLLALYPGAYGGLIITIMLLVTSSFMATEAFHRQIKYIEKHDYVWKKPPPFADFRILTNGAEVFHYGTFFALLYSIYDIVSSM